METLLSLTSKLCSFLSRQHKWRGKSFNPSVGYALASGLKICDGRWTRSLMLEQRKAPGSGASRGEDSLKIGKLGRVQNGVSRLRGKKGRKIPYSLKTVGREI